MRSVTTMDKKQLTKLISYFAMGDGGLYITGKYTNAKFIMNMKKENMDYVEYVKSTLSHIVNCTVYDRKDYNTDGCTRQPQVRLESSTHPMFTIIHDRIYCVDKHKGLDLHTLKLLDWEAMAILYMSDGCAYQYGDGYVNVTLNMKRLSEAEQLVLKQTIRSTLGVEFNINKGGKYFCLRLRNKDVNTFMDGVEPYIVNSFKYKIIRTKNSKNILDDDIV